MLITSCQTTSFLCIYTGPALTVPTITPIPVEGTIEVELGSSLAVNCTSNVPYTTFTWERLDYPYNLTEGIVTYRPEFQTSVFSIDMIQSDLYGQYRCQVTTPPPLNEGPLSTVFTLSEPGMSTTDGCEVIPCYSCDTVIPEIFALVIFTRLIFAVIYYSWFQRAVTVHCCKSLLQ